MDETTLARALAEIDEEIAAAERSLEELRVQRRGAEAFMKRLGVPTPSTASPGDAPSTDGSAGRTPPARGHAAAGNTGAVADLLMRHPEGIALAEIKHALARTGTLLDADQVRSAVTYLRRKGQAEPVSRGRWRLILPAPTNAEDPADAAAGSSGLIPVSQEGGGASGTDTHRVRDDHSSWQAEHLDHGLGAPVVGA